MASLVPPLPPAQAVALPRRGRTWVYDSGPVAEDTPVLLLLHGWTSTAALNWFRCFSPLSRDHRVVALDHRGHGRGIRTRFPFRLEDCADDAAALTTALGLGPVIPVGYSMGGPVAQLMWKRHPDRVRGLVLCATASRFGGRREMNPFLASMGIGASVALSMLPPVIRRQAMQWATRNWTASNSPAAWALEEWGRHDLAALMQAAVAMSRFDSTAWLGRIDVPTAVVVTELDVTVPPGRQRALVAGIPGAVEVPVAADHRACVDDYRLFVPALAEACASVTRRVAQRESGFDRRLSTT